MKPIQFRGKETMSYNKTALPPAEGAEKSCLSCRFHNSPTYHDKMWCRDCQQLSHYEQQPTAEGAEEILESIVESLGEPINIHNHIFEIRPYTVEHKTEWWIFHKEVGSGEPLAQWLQNFATLHAQRIAEKMVSERMEQYKAQFKDRPNPLEVNPYDSKGIKRIRNRKIH